jgi:rhomboid family protein
MRSKTRRLSQFGAQKYSVNYSLPRWTLSDPRASFSFSSRFATLLRADLMFIPLKDINPSRSYPFINISLIIANAAVFFYELSLQFTLAPRDYAAFLLSYSTVPARFPALFAGRGSLEMAFLPILTSMFLHSGFLHIAGNMLFLWIFGDNVEDFFGHIPYLFFYVVCGIGAGLVHIFFNLYSHVPALGASGAISGVMGAYILLYPRARILTLVFIFLLPIPAVVVLGEWFIMQFLAGMNTLGGAASGGVAWMAHIGGFLLGMLITAIVKLR